MQITIGENIKRLRKEKDITQEKLSEALNVSVTAVSKWERGETYPDITLIFPLAHYFNVSLDELMGYNKEKIEQDIKDTLDEYLKISKSYSTHNEALKYIKKAYQRFPNDYRVMSEYAWCLAGGYADNSKENLLSNYNELWEISEKILDGCKERDMVLGAKSLQAKLLHAQGKTNEAIKIYEENFSNSWNSAYHKIEQLFSKDTPEYRYWNKVNIYTLAKDAALKLGRAYWYDDITTDSEKIIKCEKIIDILSNARKQTNESFFAVLEYQLSGSFLFRLSALRADLVEDIARLLDKNLDSAKAITEFMKNDDALKKAFRKK